MQKNTNSLFKIRFAQDFLIHISSLSPKEKNFGVRFNYLAGVRLYSTHLKSYNIDEIGLNQESIKFVSLTDGYEKIKYKFLGVSGVYKLTNKNDFNRFRKNVYEANITGGRQLALTLCCQQIRLNTTQSGDRVFTCQILNRAKRIISVYFIEWFRGFTDGEGTFLIERKEKYYSFTFAITLHMDDVYVLNYISETLGIGLVYVYPKVKYAVFKVRAQEEIQIIIDIFTLHPLNTTKQLNFLSFTKAVKLYKAAAVKKDIVDAIENIRDSINSKRKYLEMSYPSEPSITPYWFLGFTEGDGSFFVERRNYQLGYSITQKGNKLLMEALVKYLNNLGAKKGVKSFCNLYLEGGVCKLKICREDALHFVIIPLFDSVTWRSKKIEDYLDWKAILLIKQKFIHYTPKGKDLIEKILAQMNNNRLSTSGEPRVNRTLLLTEIADLLKEPINAELKGEKIWIKSENRFLKKPSTYQKALLALLKNDSSFTPIK